MSQPLSHGFSAVPGVYEISPAQLDAFNRAMVQMNRAPEGIAPPLSHGPAVPLQNMAVTSVQMVQGPVQGGNVYEPRVLRLKPASEYLQTVKEHYELLMHLDEARDAENSELLDQNKKLQAEVARLKAELIALTRQNQRRERELGDAKSLLEERVKAEVAFTAAVDDAGGSDAKDWVHALIEQHGLRRAEPEVLGVAGAV